MQIPGVIKFIHFNNHIPAIPTEQIFWLNTLLTSEEEIKFETQYLPGVEVEVIIGPFKGLKGNVIKHKSLFRVVLWIDTLMQGISVEIDPAYLSPIFGQAKRLQLVDNGIINNVTQ